MLEGAIAGFTAPGEQKCHAESGFQPLKPGKKAAVLPTFAQN